jgi:DNA-binding transcriptional LysR family regulator
MQNHLKKGIFYNFRNLWILDTVALSGSVNAASHKLPLTQPAISRVIKNLETSLGVPIFERNHYGVVPTPFGDRVLYRVRRAMDHLASVEQLFAGEKFAMQGLKHRSIFQRTVKLRHLLALIETANYGNMTIAANRIGVTQPAICRSVRELEQMAGIPLFERRHRRMVTTRPGAALLHAAKLSLTELRYCENELSSGKGAISGQIKIGILPLLQTILVPQAVEALSQQFPGLQFSILDRPYETLLSDLRSGDIDVMVGALREPAPLEDMIEEVLFTDTLSVVARVHHPLANKKKVNIQDLAGEGWIVPLTGTLIRDYFGRMFEGAGIAAPTDIVESSSVSTVRSLLLESDRLAIISRGRIDYEERSGILAPLAILLHGTQRRIGITTRADASLPPGVEALLDRLRDLARHMRHRRLK